MHNSFWQGELTLTLHIILGLILGEIFIRLRISEIIFKKFLPFLKRNNIPSVTGLAVALSAASSKTGAALISSALEKNQISENSAVWSVLMLSLPSYLRRWPSTLALSVSMAGNAGLFYALSMLFSSIGRFFTALIFLMRSGKENTPSPTSLPSPPSQGAQDMNSNNSSRHCQGEMLNAMRQRGFKKIITNLIIAWIFFAVAYLLVPHLNKFLQSVFKSSKIFSFLPLAGWTVAAGSVAHVSAALALAGGSLASGELNTAQAVFSLILGSSLGTATRILRMNAGYYFGFFRVGLAKKMLIMNFLTIMIFMILNLFISGIFLLIC